MLRYMHRLWTSKSCSSIARVQVYEHEVVTYSMPSPIWPIMCWWDVKPYSINQPHTPCERIGHNWSQCVGNQPSTDLVTNHAIGCCYYYVYLQPGLQSSFHVPHPLLDDGGSCVNNCPRDITSSLPSFKRQLKTSYLPNPSHQFSFSLCNLCTVS